MEKERTRSDKCSEPSTSSAHDTGASPVSALRPTHSTRSSRLATCCPFGKDALAGLCLMLLSPMVHQAAFHAIRHHFHHDPLTQTALPLLRQHPWAEEQGDASVALESLLVVVAVGATQRRDDARRVHAALAGSTSRHVVGSLMTGINPGLETDATPIHFHTS